MHRFLALIAALLAAAVSVSSACTAAAPERLEFSVQQHREDGDKLQLSFRESKDRHPSWSSQFRASDLAGFDVAAFRAGGVHPINFAVIREAGRIDCSGTGGSSTAHGSCAFSANAQFANLLSARGLGRPTLEQSYALAVTGATRDLIDALAQFRYPTPDIDKLTELAAVGADRSYMAALAARGYAPSDLDDLVQLAAVGVDPAYIEAIASAGYRGLAADDLVQLKAVGVDPAFISKMAAAGYTKLTTDELVQLAALDIDPAFISAFARIGYPNLPVEKLVELKALDVTPEFVAGLAKNGVTGLTPQQLGMLKTIATDKGKR